MSDTTALLADLRKLRARARVDRQAHAFPLLLFGTLILLAPLCYASYVVPTELELIPNDAGPFPQFMSSILVRNPDVVGWYWVLTIVGGLWLTNWWYRYQARQHGVETDLRVSTAAVIAALLGFLVWQPLFAAPLQEQFGVLSARSEPAVNLPILVGSAVLATAASLWSTRRAEWPRIAGVAVAAFLATVAFGALSVYFSYGYGALVIIAAALLVLAWAERSVLLAIVGFLFTGLSLLVSLYNVENVFHRLGWHTGWDAQVVALQALLLPGTVLVVGGVVAVVRQRR